MRIFRKSLFHGLKFEMKIKTDEITLNKKMFEIYLSFITLKK